MKAMIRTAALVGLGCCLLLPACIHRGPESEVARDRARLGLAADAVKHPSEFWNSATFYYLLPGRFFHGDTSLVAAPGPVAGGDLEGVLAKIDAGYFDSLGVNVLRLTPFVERVRGSAATGGDDGYGGRDWTAVDPALGTRGDLRALVDSAHRHRIRVVMDAVIGGPAGDSPAPLPPWLIDQWQRQGRLAREQASLDSFFTRTGYPRAPRYYAIKWLTDWVREFGFDGYGIEAAEHVGDSAAVRLKRAAGLAFAQWKRANPGKVLDSLPFFMLGDAPGWDPRQGRGVGVGDSAVDLFARDYDGLVNTGFRRDAAGPLDALYARYGDYLNGSPLHGETLLNYLAAPYDGVPYDPGRHDPIGDATRLLLAPGAAQIYYGDELARPLRDLRSFMNWGDLMRGDTTRMILEHWRRLGTFRREHPAVGAGVDRTLQAKPYIFSRILVTDNVDDRVVVALDQPRGPKTVPLFGMFAKGTVLVDAYSGAETTVRRDSVALDTPFDLVLLGERPVLPSDTVTVYVTNNYALPMDIFAVAAGTTVRMGTVNPGIPSRFVLRQDLMATDRQVTFIAQTTAVGPRYVTDPVPVSPGDILDFVIETNLIGSRVTPRLGR